MLRHSNPCTSTGTWIILRGTNYRGRMAITDVSHWMMVVAAGVCSGRVLAMADQNAAGAAPLAFEVASIRRNMVGFTADTVRVEGGRLTASNVTVDQLVRNAYRMTVVGGPDWARDEPGPPHTGEVRFDVVATIPPGTPPGQVLLMFRTLLAERFKLVVHTETQQ